MLVLNTIIFAAFFQNAVGVIYKDCLEALHKGNLNDGVYEIRPSYWHSPFKVFCDQTTFGGGWIVIQRHSTSRTIFQKTLDQYKTGFGNISDEFWIGNKYIRLLTDTPHHLLVQLQIRSISRISHAHAHYESFSVSDEASGFALRVSGYSGSAGDALGDLNNMPFSIKQHSQPLSTSGWWHTDSTRKTDLNAPYHAYPPQRLWQGFGGSVTRSLTFTEMKIKPERERSWNEVLLVQYPNTVRYPVSGNFSALSVCWWMRNVVGSTFGKVFSIEYSGRLSFVLLMQQFNSTQKEIKVVLLQNTLTFNVNSREHNDFGHWCIVISSSTLKFYTNGRLSHSSPINNTNYGILIPQRSDLILGGTVELDGLAYPAYSRHDFTNFNAWDKSLPEYTIYSISGFCYAQTGSLIVAWPEVMARNRDYTRHSSFQCVAAEAMHWKLSHSNGTSISDQRKTRSGTLSAGSGGTADTKLGVLSIQGQAQADLGDISDTCLGHPERCSNGLTLRFWIRHREKILSKILGSDANHLASMDKLLQGAVPYYAKWRRCYHGDTDGFSAESFHTKCDYKGPTITLIRVGALIFGGFSDQHWGGTTRSIPSVSAFLFSIQNLANKLPFKMKIKDNHTEDALYNDNMKGPVFGTDLQIGFEEKFQVQRYSTSIGLGTSYELPEGADPGSLETQDLLTGSSEFSVDDIEVFYYDVPHKAAQLNNTQSFHESQFSASSEEKLSNFSASEAKMSRNGWCSYDQSQNQHLKLNFSRSVRISKVEFTGSAKEGGEKQGWVTKVTMTRWPANYSIELDLGNITDPNQKVVKNINIEASSLEIQVKNWKERICMRIEVLDNEGKRLVENLPDEAMTASSYAFETPAHRARLSSPWKQFMDAWCASSADTNPWIQIDLVQPQVIHFVGTQGSYNKDVVMSYSLMHSMNSTLWYNYEENGRKKIFAGNSLAWKEVKNAVLNPFLARLVRLVPLRWKGLPCLRVEIYTQVPECHSINSVLKWHWPTASSNRAYNQAGKSILNNPTKCWIPEVPQDSWLQIYLKNKYHVCCIQIEGINDGIQLYLTTSFQLALSNDTNRWVDYEDRQGQKVFEGNSVNRSSVKLFLYPTPRVKYFRIYPKTFLNLPCLRVKIFAYADKSSSTILSTNSASEGTPGLHLSYTQTYQGETVSHDVKLSTYSLTWNYSFFLYAGWHQMVIKWNKRWGLIVVIDRHLRTTYNKAGLPAKNYNIGVEKLLVGDMTSGNGLENLQISDLKYWSALIGHSYVENLWYTSECSLSNWGLQIPSTNEGNFQWQRLLSKSTPTPGTGTVYYPPKGRQKYENVAHLTTTLDHSKDVIDAWKAFDGKLRHSYSKIRVVDPQWLKVEFGRSVYVVSVEIVALSLLRGSRVDFDLEFSTCETLTLEQYERSKKISWCGIAKDSGSFSRHLTITFTNLTSNELSVHQMLYLDEVKVRTELSAGGLYIESSLPQVQGDKAYLRTTTILNIGSVGCISFRYYMNGKELGKLSAYKESYNGNEKTLLWRNTGSEAYYAYNARFPVHSKEPFQIVIEGVVGPGFLSDIVIWDNIVITFFSSCSISPSKEYLPRKKEIVSSIIGHVTSVTSSLEGWLSHVGWGEQYWRPCYSSYKDGWNTTVFHTKCDNKGPTITVIKVFDHVFGGFTDQSWSSSDNDTYKRSTKALLFSFKSVQKGFHTQYKIRQNYTFAQFLSAKEGPIFGDSELSFTQNMRIVKANPLKMFGALGNSNNGLRITENDTTFVDAVEVLHLKDSACPATCELYKKCDEITGKCVCDKSIPRNRICDNDVNQLSNHVKDAVFYWPLDGQVIDMKGQAWYSAPDDTVNRTIGVQSQGVQLRDPTSTIDLGVINTCFALIDNCTDGLTISLWMLFDHQSRGVLFSSGGEGYGVTLGICMDVDTHDLCLNVTKLHTKCSHRFTSYRSYWNHYTITTNNIYDVLVYVNGKESIISQNCVSSTSTWPAASSRVTLAGNAKFDELIVWYSVFNATKVGEIYDFYNYKDKKAMEVFFVFRLTSHLWIDTMKDKESKQYQEIKSILKNNVLWVYSNQESRSKIKTISVERLWEGSVYANLSIVYLDAIYDLPELLYNTIQQTGRLGFLPVDSLAMYLDNVYNETVQVKIVDIQDTSLTLSWSAANENAKALGNFQGYQVIGSSNGSEFYTKDLTGNITSLTVENLTSCTEFVFTVRVFSLVVYGKRSAPVSKTTMCDAPNITVSGLHGYNTSATSIFVQWDPILPAQVLGTFKRYRVYYTPTITTFPNATNNVTVHFNSSNVTLVGLQPYTNYTITVLVLNRRESKENATIVVTTDESVPVIAPPYFSIFSLSSTTLRANWQRLPLEYRGGIIRGYKLTYSSVTGNTIFASLNLQEHILSQDFSGLSYDTEYSFNISAYTSKGFGPSTTFKILTGAGVPYQKPSNLTAENWTTTSTIPVRWQPIPREAALGELQGYFLTYRTVMVGGEDVDDTRIYEMFVTSDQTHYQLSGLDSYTKYKITVAGVTKGGRGPEAMAFAETCHCNKLLSANWMTQNPYVNINSENSSGIIPEILENLVSSCCKTCKAHGESFVDYQTSSDTTGKRMDEKSLQMSISHSSDVTFPIYGYMDQDTYKAEYGFAPIVESPGVTFIVNFSDDNEKSSLVLDALFKCWPLFAFLLILIWLSGIIIWFLDSNANTQQFPTGFVRGTGNGIWWAFTTMTTVGYGDRFPVSVAARIFAVAWSLMGIVLFGMLNASLANAMTSVSFSAEVPLYGCKVGAIQDSPEHRVGIRKNAKVNLERQYESYEDIASDLLEGQIKGALIDTYVLSKRKDLFERPSFRIMKVLDYSSAYGVVLGGTSRKLTKCFKGYMSSNRATVFGIIQKNVGKVEDNHEPLALKLSSNLFDSNSKEYSDTILYLIVLLAAAIVLGFLWSINLKKTHKISNAANYRVEAEMKTMFTEFNERMESLVKRLKRDHAIQLLKVLKHQAIKKQETEPSPCQQSSQL